MIDTILEKIPPVIEALIRLMKEFAKLTFRTQTLVVVVLIFVSFNFGQCDGDAKVNDFRQKYVALQANAVAAQKFSDSAKTQVAQLVRESKQKDDSIIRLKVTVDVANKQRSTLRNNLGAMEDRLEHVTDIAERSEIQQGIIYNLKEQVTEAEEVITQQKTIIDQQDVKILKLDQALALATERADRFEDVNKQLIDLKPPPRIWLNKKVLGTTAFIAGVVVGNKIAQR